MTEDVEAIARGLTAAQRHALLTGKCGVPATHGDYNLDCLCASDHSLIDIGLAYRSMRWPNQGVIRTPLGLAVRAHLIAQGETA